MFLLLFLFTAFLNTSVYAIIGPYTVSEVYSNPVWVDNDKIAYFELVDYCQAQIVTSKTYRLNLVLNIKSLNDPLYHKKISWTIPENDWRKYKISRGHLSFSPKGDKIVFSIGKDKPTYEGEIYIAELKDNSKLQKIVDNGLNPEWSPEGNSIAYQGIGRDGAFTTDDGKFSTNWQKGNKLIEIRNDTKLEVALIEFLIGQKPKWSSDGNKIIFSAADKIFITDKDGRSVKHIKVPYKQVGDPALSPDMAKVVFSKYKYEENHYWVENNLYIADARTGNVAKEIIKPNGVCANKDAPIFDAVWSPDGESIAYTYNCSARAIFVIKNDGSGLKQIAGYGSHFGWD